MICLVVYAYWYAFGFDGEDKKIKWDDLCCLYGLHEEIFFCVD